MTDYNIYLYVKGDWIDLSGLKLPTEVLQLFTNEVADQIALSQGAYRNPPAAKESVIVGTDDKLELFFLNKMRFRRCTIYPVLQYSFETNKLRLLFYGTDQVLHKAASFGTSLMNVQKDEMLEHAYKHIKADVKPDNVSNELYEQIDNIIFGI